MRLTDSGHSASDPSPSEDSIALSDRERDVLRLVTIGARIKAIAAQLSILENTGKFHASNLFRKAGASNRAEPAGLTSHRK